MSQPPIVNTDEPTRISADDIRILIEEIRSAGASDEGAAGKPSEQWSHYQEDHVSAEDVNRRILYEQDLVDTQLRGEAQCYVITASGTRRVHLPSCYHVRHVIHRDEAWKYVTETPGAVNFRELGLVYAMPYILTREQVETLNSYVACQACVPTLDHQRKTWVLNTRPMKATSIGSHHIGRDISTEDGQALGRLISHQRIVTAAGIRSITTTTETTIEGDGTEKYHLAQPTAGAGLITPPDAMTRT